MDNVNVRNNYFRFNGHENLAYPMPELEEDSRWHILKQIFRGNIRGSLIEQKNEILSQIQQQDPLNRPLFTFFSGIALVEGENIKGWDTNQNLQYHLNRQEVNLWSKNPLWELHQRALKNLIWLATMCEYITPKDILDYIAIDQRLIDFELNKKNRECIEELFKVVNEKNDHETFYGIKPDIFGEYYIVNYLEEIEEDSWESSELAPLLFVTSFLIDPENSAISISITSDNFFHSKGFNILENFLKTYYNADFIPQSVEYGYLLTDIAGRHYMQNRFQEAKTFLLLAAELQTAYAYIGLALIYQHEDNSDLAIKCFLKAIQLCDNDPFSNLSWVYYQFAKFYRDNNNFEEAKIYYGKAMEFETEGSLESIVALAELFLKEGNEKEAERTLLIGLERDDAKSIHSLGILKRSQGNMAEAQKYLQNSLNLNNFESAISLGLIYVDQNEIALAERVFLKAINSKDSAPIAYRNLAFLYYQDQSKKGTIIGIY